MVRVPRSSHNRTGRPARERSLLLASISAALWLSGCTPAPAGDEAAMVRATLALLARDRAPDARRLCVDSRPRGEPLAIWRTMRLNTEPDDRQWREPAPLRGEPRVDGRQLFDDATDRRTLRIPEPRDPAPPLPRDVQAALDAAARAQSIDGQSTGFALDGSVAPAEMTVRWWLLNRVLSGCDRTIVLSRLVHGARYGFVTVTVDHWGTTYALERADGAWRVAGQWDRWLY